MFPQGARLKIQDIKSRKNGLKISVLTAYDYPFARFIDEAGVDIILVGDSLANVVLGLESTTQVGMTEMLHHSKAVSRAVKSAMVLVDMPFDSYQNGVEQTVQNAWRFINEAGCEAVKMEWFENCLPFVEAIVKSGVAVVGHVGLTPQSAEQLGGFKVQGKDAESAIRIAEQSEAMQEAGCFAMVLECVPEALAKIITGRLAIPTIGIGAGRFCDGQVLVVHDILGLFDRFQPKFVKQYVNVADSIRDAVRQYKVEVEGMNFPSVEQSYQMDASELEQVRVQLKKNSM